MILGHIGGAVASVYSWLIEKSLRLRSSVNANLTRNPGASGNKTTCTWSFWFKPSLYSNKTLFGCALSGSQIEAIGFDNGFGYGAERLHFVIAQGGILGNLLTTRRFRDPSAWYHIVIVYDSTNATASDRIRMYVNGVRETAFDVATYPSQNFALAYLNNNYVNYINQLGPNYASYQSDGYLAEVRFIDGQALDASSFGQFESSTGVWVPKKYTGTYGTTGYYLDFKNGTNLSTLGQDASGNGNNWTCSNVSLTAGSTYDWVSDTPTNNYAVLNALKNYSNTVNDGNLSIAGTSASVSTLILATIGVASGKWYWEFTQTAFGSANAPMIGLATDRVGMNNYVGADANGFGYYGNNGQKWTNGVGAAYGASYTNADVVGVEFDADAGTLTFYKNGVSQGVAFTGLTNGPYFPAFGDGGTTATMIANVNFGQRPFVYTPTAGFKALCSQNLPEPVILNPKKHFDVLTWAGNGSTSRAITGTQFKPDFAWIKQRNVIRNHVLSDAVRVSSGYPLPLYSDLTNAEGGTGGSVFALPAFNSDGIQINNNDGANNASGTYVGWLWKAGGAPVANTDGAITTQVSANRTAGFSIVTYTGNGVAGTRGHGLGVTPELIILKDRLQISNWAGWHKDLTLGNAIYQNLSNGQGADPTVWNSTAPNSTTFTVGANAAVNTNTSTYVAYCFASIPGFSVVGKYTGNGSADGPFIYCGFRPKYVLFKRVDTTGTWYVLDVVRNTYNTANLELYSNLANAEGVSTATIDIVSNGFKFRVTDAQTNASGGTYIFMAFAEAPFKYANAR